MKTFVDIVVYLLIRIVFGWVRLVPVNLAHFFCEALAVLVFRLDKKHRRIGMINLGIAFPEKDWHWKQDVLRRSFKQLGNHVVEFSRLSGLTASQVGQRVEYEDGRGLENYHKAKQDGRPLLFLTAHISVWELLPVAHALLGNTLSFVVRPLDNPFLQNWSTELRTSCGNQVLSKNRSLRQVLKVLEKGEDVGFLIDQNVQEKEGVYVPFFGHSSCTSSILAALALKTSASIVVGFIYPSEDVPGHYRMRFHSPIQLSSSGDYKKDLVQGTAKFNRYIEEMIREYPHCWLWGHRRFQTQPDGTNLYDVERKK